LWSPPDAGSGSKDYNIIVDVNQDGYFTNSIDVIDVFNGPGFRVNKCQVVPETLHAAAEPQPSTDTGDRDFLTGVPVYFSGENLNPNDTVRLYITAYDKDFDYIGNNPKILSDVRSNYDDVTIDNDGKFSGISWRPVSGFYNIILDVNQDGNYTFGTDLIDHTNEIGFAVFNNRSGHNDMIHLGDNGLEREVYNTKIAQNIYTLAKNLPANKDVNIYTISERLLKINNPEWDTWESSNNVNLLNSATPVYEFGEKTQTAHTSSEGTIFLSIWKSPNKIFDQPFINYYGKKYNVIIDVNRDGIFNSGDMVDTHDIGDMTNWFYGEGHLDLSSTVGSGTTPAVSEYKEYLNDKLDLENQLDTTNDIYDSSTEQASKQYLCSKNLSIELFKVIEIGSQVGFRVLGENEYYAERNLESGRQVYDQVEFDGLNINDNTTSVIVAPDGNMELGNLNIGENSLLFSNPPSR